MALFKTRPDDAPPEAGPPTRAEFEELRREFGALKRIVATGFMAVEECGRYQNVHGGPASTHVRLEKIAAAASDFGLDAAELRAFLALIEKARGAESVREREEEIARTNAPTWRADGTYGRRIPGT